MQTFGSFEMFARRPSWRADRRVNPNKTVAATHCHFSVGVGTDTKDGKT